jgi:hypothetical protein
MQLRTFHVDMLRPRHLLAILVVLAAFELPAWTGMSRWTCGSTAAEWCSPERLHGPRSPGPSGAQESNGGPDFRLPRVAQPVRLRDRASETVHHDVALPDVSPLLILARSCCRIAETTATVKVPATASRPRSRAPPVQ